MTSVIAEAYLRNIVVLAESLKLGIELADTILVCLACQPRHLFGQLGSPIPSDGVE